MRKLISLLTVSMLLAGAATTFAATTYTDAGIASGGLTGATGVMANYRPSTNVRVGVEANASNYAAIAGHNQGDRQFGGSSDDVKIYFSTKTAGTDITAPTTSTATATFGTGWSSL
jgi:hypothetical protein